jgi:hypothetical protein
MTNDQRACRRVGRPFGHLELVILSALVLGGAFVIPLRGVDRAKIADFRVIHLKIPRAPPIFPGVNRSGM